MCNKKKEIESEIRRNIIHSAIWVTSRCRRCRFDCLSQVVHNETPCEQLLELNNERKIRT